MSSKSVANILIIEDNEGDIELVTTALNRANEKHKIEVVRDGDEAIDYLYQKKKYKDKDRPDIIFLDLNLPRRNGKEILNIVKKDENLKNIPIMVLTSSSAERDVEEVYNLDANCYLVKPVDALKFMELVMKVEVFWNEIINIPAIQN